ncbi:MAG TPA: ABC transporter substrate-binding protein [Flavobacteriales bacterium]
MPALFRSTLAPFFAACLLSACSDPAPPVRNGRSGGLFNLNETEELRSIFPLTLTQASARRIAGQIYEGLVRFDPKDLSIQPGLAESWDIDEAGTTYIFHLRKGVHFHDDPAFPEGRGREVMAADVVDCFNRVCTHGEGDQTFRLFQDLVVGASARYAASADEPNAPALEGVMAVDEHTVRIQLTRRTPLFLMILADAGCWIHPRELTMAYGKDLMVHAIGTGPFMLRTARTGEAMVLQRNPEYWATDSSGVRLPYLDGIRVTFSPNKVHETAQFMNGNLTILDKPPTGETDVLKDSIGADGKPRFIYRSIPSFSVQYYGFNGTKPPFNDPRVRRAFGMAIDRRSLVDSVLSGAAVAALHGLIPPGAADYPYDRVPGVPYAPDSARRLLREAGYPDGQGLPPLTLQVNNDGYRYVAVAEAVQEMLHEQLGVAVTLSVLPARQHYARIEAGGAALWRGGWIADHPDPANFLSMLYGQYAVTDTSLPSGFNTTRYKDPVFDPLYTEAGITTGVRERMDLLAAAEERLMQDLPVIPLYHERSVRLMQPYVRDLFLNPMELLDLTRVWFDPATRPVR